MDEITDYDRKSVLGTLYAEELQRVTKTDDVYDIERVLKTRKIAGVVEHLVQN